MWLLYILLLSYVLLPSFPSPSFVLPLSPIPNSSHTHRHRHRLTHHLTHPLQPPLTSPNPQGLTRTLFLLAAHPQYIAPLREEVTRVISEEGWTKTAVNNLQKLDSVIREGMRVYPGAVGEYLFLILQRCFCRLLVISRFRVLSLTPIAHPTPLHSKHRPNPPKTPHPS